MLNFAILDDNIRTVKKISQTLDNIFLKYDFDAQICCATTKIDKLFEFLKSKKLDVLILDINLQSNLTGIEIAEKIRKNNKDCYFIFATAYLEYGLLAYKCKTFDFIAKPIEARRLEDSIIRLFEDVSNSKKRFIKLNTKNTIIDENEIDYIQRDGMKLIFHTNFRNYEVYNSLNKIQENLPNNFVRCHKSFIANVNNITEIDSSNNIIYFDSSFCDIGPKYKNKFMEVIGNYGKLN